eukprot:TRINITY_DN43327_c0_g1_i3.p1 TRINITY_DN43327_c0_g1~~TRINITY_DN43327_c0_g1_i3.p1  ORF type:complete len:246 (-),score=60.17 TRINITY_DN43327_c0_g1_i3:145-882(-)
MEELYGGEDELLGQGSSMDPAGQPSGLASALTNPAERFDLAAGSSGGGWANKPSSSTQPTRAENSKWRNFPERDHTSEVRITIWNSTQQRKISGNAAPMEKNVDEYLRKHPDCAIYNGQDKNPGFHKSDMEDRASPRSRSAADRELDSQRRVSIWNRQDKRKLSGNCAPLERNLEQYLRDNPHCEVHHSEGKGKKVNKRPRKDGIGDGMSRASIHPGDVANGHQGFVHYDPFAGESIHNLSLIHI